MTTMKTGSINRRILFADLAWCGVAFFAAISARYSFSLPAERIATHVLWPFLAAAAVIWIFLSFWMKLDCFHGGWRLSAVVSQIFLAEVCLMSLLLTASYLRREYVSRLVLSYFGILMFVGFICIRYVARLLLEASYRNGDVRRVVIAGNGRIARELALKISRHPEMVCKVVGFLFPDGEGNLSALDSEGGVAVPTVGVVDLLSAQRADDLILALPATLPEVLTLASRCRDRGINVSFVPQPYELYLSKPTLLDLDGIPLLELREASASDLFFQGKRLADILIGTALSIIALPILLSAGAVLRWAKGRAFRWETRCGQYGVSFRMLRLNVDRHSSDVTPFERALESMSITELPQLWNVLRGEMSLVGPRPESQDRVKRYSEWQQRRLTVKPGLTGLAQVHGLRDQSSSEEKTRFDLQYILHPSAITDISILLQTLWTLTVRLFQYPWLTAAAVEPRQTELNNQAVPQFLQETLERAHRS